MMRVLLHTLPPGTRFKLPDDPTIGPGKRGVLLYATECRARVKWVAKGPQTLEVVAYKGTAEEMKFTVPNIEAPMDIAANTEVEVI